MCDSKDILSKDACSLSAGNQFALGCDKISPGVHSKCIVSRKIGLHCDKLVQTTLQTEALILLVTRGRRRPHYDLRGQPTD